MTDRYPWLRDLAICGLLLLAVGVVFGQTVRYEFVNFDDNLSVYQNPHVLPGLTAEGLARAFTHTHVCSWIPLTCISQMLDCQLYGLSAGGHHLTNVLLHAATAVLLFLVLRQMTGGVWPSALVAALFAVHPLQVEPVAWVTARKDILSGLFFVLTLWAYVSYARRPFALIRYLAVVDLFCLGLMACAWRQTTFWQDSETLWTHTLDCTSRNSMAHHHFAIALSDWGLDDDAMVQFLEVRKLEPRYIVGLTHPHAPLTALERCQRAATHYRRAVDRNADDAEAGRFPEALATARKALELAERQDKQDLAHGLRTRIARYESGKAFRAELPEAK